MQERTVHPLHIAALGCTALVSQSVFVREILSLFTGTELAVGAVLASWLFWVGTGALAGGRAASGGRGPGYGRFLALAAAAAALSPLTVLGIRIARSLLARPPGAIAPLGPSLAVSFLAVAPFAFVYGSIYNTASVLWRERRGGVRNGIVRVYLWEAAGSVVGAVLFSFFVVSFFSQLEAALVAGLLLLFAAALVPPPPRRRTAIAAGLFAVVFLSSAAIPALDRWSMGRIFPGYRIERFYSSRFGEVVVADRDEVRSVFSGGARLYSIPEPERTQETVHLPLLAHPAPRSVLLIGGSLGGGWREAVKHPSIESVDCVELDGSLFDLEHGPGASRDTAVAREARGGTAVPPVRVRFIAGDGRFHLSAGDARYDVVIVSAPAPVNLQWNRFFTREFFEIARRALEPGGVLAIAHPSSENFLSRESARALRCVELTLRDAMPAVVVLPGNTACYLAGERPVDPALMTLRLEERGIEAAFVGRDYLPFRLSPERMELLRGDLERAGETRRNRDARPALPLYELAVEARRMGSSLAGAAGAAAGLPGPAPALALGAALLVLFAAARGRLRPRLAVSAVGFGSFLLQLLILLAYQSFTGLLYHGIVMLTALFMAGAAAGAAASIRRERWGGGALRTIHGLFLLLALALAGWPAFAARGALSFSWGSAVFLCLAAAGGALTGAYYPIVVRRAFPEGGKIAPATFYGWDLLGACAAGAIGGLALFPLLGLAGTAIFVAFVHALAAALLAGRGW